MSMMAMGVTADTLRPGDHLLGVHAGETFTATVTVADDASVDDVKLIHLVVLDDLGVLWDFFESAETVMTAVVWTEDGDE